MNPLRMLGLFSLLMIATSVANARTPFQTAKLTPHRIALSGRKPFDLKLPAGFKVTVAAEGLKRLRFMARSPDGRVFVTDMFNLADNKKGTVYILDEFDPETKRFKKVTPYLAGLRNPNSIAFYTDALGTHWFYLALTDRLVRYKFTAGETAPSAEPQVLATFPDYGLSYKYGGWHLTRTIVISRDGAVYVSVGSSCNACEEKEEVRASVLVMDADGKNQRHFARGLRNAVGMRETKAGLFATNMGADHLGDHKPADTMYLLKDGENYGWPHCYQSGAGRFPDPKFNPRSRKMNCRKVPQAFAAFDSHSSPLGLEYFDESHASPLSNSFLVALHGSTNQTLGHGYRVVQLRQKGNGPAAPEDFITGFIEGVNVRGRPVDILAMGPGAFLLTDDYAGAIYYVYKQQ